MGSLGCGRAVGESITEMACSQCVAGRSWIPGVQGSAQWTWEGKRSLLLSVLDWKPCIWTKGLPVEPASRSGGEKRIAVPLMGGRIVGRTWEILLFLAWKPESGWTLLFTLGCGDGAKNRTRPLSGGFFVENTAM